MSLRTRFFLYLIAVHLLLFLLAGPLIQRDRLWLLALEAVVVVSALVGVLLIRSLLRPLELIRSGVEFIRERDFTVRFRPVGQPDVDRLTEVYNEMVDHLREERTRLQEQHYLLESLLEASPTGILILDYDGRIESANPAALEMTGCSLEDLRGRALGDTGSPLLQQLGALLPGQAAIYPLQGRRRIRGRCSHLMDRGFSRHFLLLEELTEELRRSEKEAYEKLIRMMSHEVNNSVGAAGSLLQSCLGYAGQLQEEDRLDFEKALGVVLGRIQELNRFMRGFAEVVRIPLPRLSPCDARALLEGIRLLFASELESRRIQWQWEQEPDFPDRLPMDQSQMEQVLINLVRNALDAIQREGTLRVRLDVHQQRPRILLADSGPGIPAEVQPQLFKPFFSTKENGQGIGLTLIQEILNRHPCDYALERSGEWTQFWILWRDTPATPRLP